MSCIALFCTGARWAGPEFLSVGFIVKLLLP